VELVDQAGALPDGGLESGGDLAQWPQLRGQMWRWGGPLTDGEVGTGAGLDGVRLFAAKQSGTVVLVALRVAARDGDAGLRDGAGPLWRLSGEVMEEV
jgi:hypothetical protein